MTGAPLPARLIVRGDESEPAGRRRRAGSGVALLVLLGVTLAALAHVGVQARRIEIGRALGDESRRHAELVEEQRRTRLEIGELKSPARLVEVARREGMGAPAPGDLRVPPPVRQGSP